MNQLDISELLERGTEEIIGRSELEEKLLQGHKLRVKLGIDPTSPNLHLGRSIPLLKLKDFQKRGHIVVFIIGDFTGQIGDTSDKDSERPMILEAQVKENFKTYLTQAAKIIDVNKAEIFYNSEWLSKLDYKAIGMQADAFSLNSFISRDNIKKRLDLGKRVSLRELLYPLMQGYDSVMVKADVEIGGTDQKFNLLAGRDLQKLYKQQPQQIILNPIIEGLDGRKMSSSLGNTVNLSDSPNDMFGKIMSLSDQYIIKYFELLTRIDIKTVAEFAHKLETGTNPKDIKLKLAYEITRMYHGPDAADSAQEYFINTFFYKKIPNEITEFKPSRYDIISVLVESKICPSRSDATRQIKNGGIRINQETIGAVNYTVVPGSLLQKGKRNFLKIV